jgi:hypothetical protein
MAKRGETRPWRLTFVWDNGIKGVETFAERAYADDQADRMREYADRIDRSITLTITNRNDKDA